MNNYDIFSQLSKPIDFLFSVLLVVAQSELNFYSFPLRLFAPTGIHTY